MWTRAELKTKAKAALRGGYWQAFLVSLLILVAGSSDSVKPNFEYRMDRSDFMHSGAGSAFSGVFQDMLPLIGAIGLGIFLIVVAYRIFIGYPLEVGGRRYFIEAAEQRRELGNIGRGFNGQWYGNVVKAMFLKGLAVFGWTLLLIIPGIIKAYAYRLVPYILAENPLTDPKEARVLSDRMTSGHKMSMFVLDLSFIGWYILGALALGVGTLFVHPYYNSTVAELYLVLKHQIPDNGGNYEEGHLDPPPEYDPM